jgi:type VI secretion system Hcp family effector
VRTQQISKEEVKTMKRLIGLAMTILLTSSSVLAAGDVNVTITGNNGQTNTRAVEFRYSQSPRDLAGGSASMAAAGTATSARGVASGRAAMRRTNDAVTIVKAIDDTSSFFVKAAASGETFTSVGFEFKRTVGTTTEVFQTVTLTNATISAVREINGDGNRLMQEVSFTFQKIEYSNKDGAAAAPTSWN